MIEWLGVTARFNGGTFFDTHEGFGNERFNEAYQKDKANRTESEQKLIELVYEHMRNRNGQPILDFVDGFAVAGSFRYLGKGVRLGSSDRIVLVYKLKSTEQYRAVFGDLTVRDVSPDELPLPVE